MKTHYKYGCYIGQWGITPSLMHIEATDDMNKVTCGSCLNIIRKKNLQPRSNFPERPTFDVVAEGHWKYKDIDSCHLVFNCPVCGMKIRHGGRYGQLGKADGHRVAHCQCWEHGYYIHEIDKNKAQ